MSSNRKDFMKLLGDFSTIGLTMATSVFVGFGFGYWLDKKVFGGRTAPWFMMIFLVLGIAAGFRSLYQLAMRKDL